MLDKVQSYKPNVKIYVVNSKGVIEANVKWSPGKRDIFSQ